MAKDETVKAAGINTRLAHSGNDPHAYFGFVNPPVVHASTVLFADARTMADRDQKYTYGTRGTPTTDALAAAINELEGSAGTVIVPSGLAAVVVPLLAYLSAGDHALIVNSVYFPTRKFANSVLKRLGVEVEYYDPLIGAGIGRLMKPNTRLVFTESPGSNTYEVQDIPAIAKAAHAGGAIVVMDNTWATPLYFKALDHGVDVIVHASTKYPAGHSDVLLGTVSANAACWPQLNETFLTLGVCAGPDDVYQVLRGLRTHGRQARTPPEERAGDRALAGRPSQASRACCTRRWRAIPATPSGSAISRAPSGVFSIVLDGGGQNAGACLPRRAEDLRARLFLGRLRKPRRSRLPGDRIIARGPYEGPLIRLQIGLEDVADLKADIERGLAAAAGVL